MKTTPQMGDEAVRASWSILAMDCESCVESSHVNNKNDGQMFGRDLGDARWWPGGLLLTPDRASVGGKMLE